MPETLDVSYETAPALALGLGAPEPIVVTVAPAETLVLEADGEALTVEAAAPEAFVVLLGPPETLAFSLLEPETIVVELGGRRGPAGPPGAGGDGASAVYRHHQAAPAPAWTVSHDLGYYPAVTVTDSAGSVVEGDVDYVNENALIITFSVAFGGYANLS